MEKIKTYGEPLKEIADWELEVFRLDNKGRRQYHREHFDYDALENLLIALFVMIAMVAMFVCGMWMGKFIWGC